MKPKLSPKERDRALARERMRRLRVNGMTTFDAAYNEARAELIRRHRDEFDAIREDILDGVRS
jgi:hypothetical protein